MEYVRSNFIEKRVVYFIICTVNNYWDLTDRNIRYVKIRVKFVQKYCAF